MGCISPEGLKSHADRSLAVSTKADKTGALEPRRLQKLRNSSREVP